MTGSQPGTAAEPCAHSWHQWGSSFAHAHGRGSQPSIPVRIVLDAIFTVECNSKLKYGFNDER